MGDPKRATPNRGVRGGLVPSLLLTSGGWRLFPQTPALLLPLDLPKVFLVVKLFYY